MIERTTDWGLEQLRIQARLEIGEKDELIPTFVQELRDVLNDDENLKLPSDNKFLIRFLRANKYDVECAAKMVKKYFLLQSSIKDISDLIKPSCHIDLFKTDGLLISKRRDLKGRQILVQRVSKWDTSQFTFDEIFAASFFMFDAAIENVDTQYNGVVMIIDCKGFGFSHLKQIRPRRLQAMANIMQGSYPIRFKEIHVVNHPVIINMVYTVIKPFLREKMRERINFHSYDISSLHNCISPELLPEDLEGHLSNEEFSDTESLDRIMKMDDYYTELKTFGYH